MENNSSQTARNANGAARTLTSVHAVNDAAPALQAHAPTAEAQAADAPRSKRKPYAIVGALTAAVLVAVTGYWLMTRGKESTDDAQIEADVVSLSSRVPGQVDRVLVQDDQRVTKGQVLIELGAADYLVKVEAARAELETARAQAAAADAQVAVASAGARGGFSSAQAAVTGSSANVASAEAQLQAARANLTRAEASAKKAQIDLERSQKLRAGGVVPQANLDDAQATNEEAQAALLQARAQVSAAEEARTVAKTRVGEARGTLARSSPVKPQIAAAEANARLAAARIESAQAALKLAELQLSYTKVIAPADGTVSRLSARVGQILQPGQPLAQLVPLQTYVIANFKETQIGEMRPGQPAEVELDAYGGRKLQAKVESLAGGTGSRFALLPPDNATGNFVKVVQRVPVRLALVSPPADLPLRAGLSAEVTVHVGR
jgi:membrane fusion protein (multidrug efflux system)